MIISADSITYASYPSDISCQTAISSTLVKKGTLSSLDCVGRLLDGLSPDLRCKVLKFCAKKDWRLSAHDIGSLDPNFNELKPFVSTEAQATQKRLLPFCLDKVLNCVRQLPLTPEPPLLAPESPVPVSTPLSNPLLRSSPVDITVFCAANQELL